MPTRGTRGAVGDKYRGEKECHIICFAVRLRIEGGSHLSKSNSSLSTLDLDVEDECLISLLEAAATVVPISLHGKNPDKLGNSVLSLGTRHCGGPVIWKS